MGKTREESATIPQAQNSLVSLESPEERTQRRQANWESVQQMSKNSHDVHINSYHVLETCIREGAHLRMPASSQCYDLRKLCLHERWAAKWNV
jgi:hypothetical protein